MSKEEIEEVTLKLPKKLVGFIKKMEGNVEQYLTLAIVELHVSYIESIAEDLSEYPETIMEKYDLKRVFKEYGVLPGYYKDP